MTGTVGENSKTPGGNNFIKKKHKLKDDSYFINRFEGVKNEVCPQNLKKMFAPWIKKFARYCFREDMIAISTKRFFF